MDKRNQFNAMAATRTGLLGGFLTLALTQSCAPTLSGQLQTPTSNLDSTGATVLVTKLDSTELHQTYTADVSRDGSFSLRNLPKGTYLVEAIVPHFKVASAKIEIEKPQTLNLKLEPLENGSISLFNMRDTDQSPSFDGSATLNPPNL